MHQVAKFSIIAFLAPLLMTALSWATATDAHADQVKYIGVHPIADVEGAFCHIEVPHVHVYKPAPKKAEVLYRQHDGAYHFVGDPVAFKYDGPKYSYYGHHPVRVDVGVHLDIDLSDYDDEYCYLDGPHFHSYEPPTGQFEYKGDAYWYVGKYPKAYGKHKKRYVGINQVYQPIVYTRPTVVIEERPAAYVGPIVELNVVAPVVEVEAVHPHADVEVVVPVPSVHIDVGLPGVRVGHKKHRKYRKYRKSRKYRKYRKHK